MQEMQTLMDDMMAAYGDEMPVSMVQEMGRMMGMMESMSGMMENMSGMMQGDMMQGASGMSGMSGMMAGGMMDSMHAGMKGMMEQMQGMMGSMKDAMPPDMAADMAPRMAEMEQKMSSMLEMMEGMGAMMAGMSDGMAGMDQGADAVQGGHNRGPVSSEGVPAATAARGAQPLEPTVIDGVKVFTLTAEAVQWPIMQAVTVTAWTYNGMVPGPLLRVTEGDNVRIVVVNNLPEATSVHWHGILVPNDIDGVPPMTQAAIEPGETFTYAFEAKPAGSFMYHSHVATDQQILLGLYAPFIIDPRVPEADAPDVDVTMMLSEWRVVDGMTYPAMPLAGMEPNYFTINGKAFPDTEPINVKVGDKVRIRFMGIGQFSHPMHLHGMPFKVVATDGYPVPEGARLTKDTILVSPGERYDIEFTATTAGQWMLHCHIPHHITNDGVEPGGLVVMVNVSE